MTPLKGWKKFLAVGCSHGAELCPEARKAVLTFREKWKPDTVIHLGDFLDLVSFRGGAVRDSNDPDHAASVSEDLSAGLEFLHELRPTHVLMGNHEARLYHFASSPNALLAHAATLTIERIDEALKKLKAKSLPYTIRSHFTLGDTKFLHGFMFNVAAIRDHAETYGNCVLAHLHRVGWERARRSDHASGYCTGTLARLDMGYAATRRATFAWSQGFAYGFYNDRACSIHLIERRPDAPWLLPL